jgi:hypothetical protein
MFPFFRDSNIRIAKIHGHIGRSDGLWSGSQSPQELSSPTLFLVLALMSVANVFNLGQTSLPCPTARIESQTKRSWNCLSIFFPQIM